MKGVETLVTEITREAEEALRALEARRRAEEEALRADEEGQRAVFARLQGLGYEPHLAWNTVLRRWEAVALYGERMVGYGWGATRLEAARSLAGDLGVSL